MPGVRAETSSRVNGSDDTEGVSGLKALGVRELSYKMAFLAYHVQPCNAKVIVNYVIEINSIGNIIEFLFSLVAKITILMN